MSETSSKINDDCRCDYSYYRRKGKPKFQGESTTKSHYKPYQLEKKPAYQQPKIVEKHYDKDFLKTSYKTQYQKPEVTYEKQKISPSSLIQSYYDSKNKNAPFYSETEYNKSYQKNKIAVERQPPVEYKPKGIKFQGSSAYKQQFTKKENSDLKDRSAQNINYSDIYKKNKAKFEGVSAYKETFQKYELNPQKQPKYVYQPKNIKFQGESNYKTTFTPFSKDTYRNQLQYCPIHPERIAIIKK